MNPLAQTFAGIFNPIQDSQQLDTLAGLLEMPVAEVASLRSDQRVCYRPFTIKKRGNGRRKIAEPTGYLKQIQRRLLRNYLATLPVHFRACAYRPGYSVMIHAGTHANQQLLLTADLQDFFPATSTRRVRRFFADYGWRDEALKLLVRLTTFRGGLPQGAPTSPALSNLVNYSLDHDLNELATIHGAFYSRYADDLAFSWARHDCEPRSFCSSVTGFLERYGYQIQPLKGWKRQHATDHPEITGIAICGNRLRPRKELIAERRRLRWRWFKSGRERAKLAGLNGFFKQLRRGR